MPEAQAHPYGVRDVERLLGISRPTIRSLVDAGFVTPARGARNAWRFGFQDLIVLRTAQSLVAAAVPRRRILRALRELRRGLPESMPLTGLRIAAEADRVIVLEGSSRWQAESGQYLLGFEGDPERGQLKVVEAPAPPPAPAAEGADLYDIALAREGARDGEGALAAYAAAIEADPSHIDARINRALLLHDRGRLAEAERAYREALDACGDDAIVLYNLGILLEDLRRPAEAIESYRASIRVDPALADAHYNLSLLLQKAGKRTDAIRHISQYRRLTAGRKA